MATPYTLQRLYSPSKKYADILNLWDDADDLNDEQYFRLLICDSLLATKDFDELVSLKIPESISDTREQEIIYEEVEHFFNYCDDLPVFPSADDCLLYLNAPRELIEKYVAGYIPQTISDLLPRTKDNELTILFEEKLKQLYEAVKLRNKHAYYLKKINLTDLQLMFSILADKRDVQNDLFDDEILVEEVKTFFSAELAQIHAYETDLNTNMSKVIESVKNQRLSQVDTVVTILKMYF